MHTLQVHALHYMGTQSSRAIFIYLFFFFFYKCIQVFWLEPSSLLVINCTFVRVHVHWQKRMYHEPPSLFSLSIDQSCSLALKQLWDYVVSTIAGTVYKWSVVITRFGKPSTSEIARKLPSLVLACIPLCSMYSMCCFFASYRQHQPYV